MLRFDRLDEAVRRKGISKAHLCRLVGVSKAYIQNAKNREHGIPDGYIETWAQALGVSPYWLKGLIDDPEEAAPPAPADDLIAFYGEVHEVLTESDKAEIAAFMAQKAQLRQQQTKEQVLKSLEAAPEDLRAKALAAMQAVLAGGGK